MSSVRKKDQSEHRFTVLDKCLDLYEHTTTVTANPKFQQCASLTDRLNDEAAIIYHFGRPEKGKARTQENKENGGHGAKRKTHKARCRQTF